MGSVNQFSRKNDRSTVLLIGNNASDSDVIKRQLALSEGTSCHVWDCSDDEEALDLLSVQGLIPMQNTNIDVVIMDLTSPGVDYPKERFIKAKSLLPEIPLVVLLDQTDYDLSHFVMKEGAAETLSLSQIASDPGRLQHLLVACRARDNRAQLLQQQASAELKECKAQNAEAIKMSNSKNEAILHYVYQRHLYELNKLKAENELLRNEIKLGAEAVRDIKSRSYAILRNVQERNESDVFKMSQQLLAMGNVKPASQPTDMRGKH